MQISDFIPAASTAAAVLSKAADLAVGESPYRIEGSLEHAIDQVRDPLCKAAPHPADAEYHWADVIGTFPDRGIVHCASCGKWWEIPYTIKTVDGAEVVETGEPQERVQAYISPGQVPAESEGGSTE
jgi:hypothetical protein